MSETRYNIVRGYCDKMPHIEAVTVLRTSEKTVTVEARGYANGRRENKRGFGKYNYFPTWEEAHAKLLADEERTLHRAHDNVKWAEQHLSHVAGMVKPS